MSIIKVTTGSFVVAQNGRNKLQCLQSNRIRLLSWSKSYATMSKFVLQDKKDVLEVRKRGNNVYSPRFNRFSCSTKAMHHYIRRQYRCSCSIKEVHQCLKSNAGFFTLIIFQMVCDCYCSVALPNDAMGWSAVCDCGISWS